MEQKDRPRIAVIGYGSLLQPSELVALADDVPDRAIPVKIDGLKRVFDQRTSWRTDDNIECAVANAVRSDDSWMNGIFLPDISRSEFNTFRERERWYRLIEVSTEDIEPYDDTGQNCIEQHELVLTTTGLETASDIEPIPRYANACLKGAAEWGEEFRNDFLETTETNTGCQLTKFIN